MSRPVKKTLPAKKPAKMSAEVKPELIPDKELTAANGRRWFYFTEDQIGLGLVGLEDSQTGLIASTTIVNPRKRVAAHRAWDGARQSRAAGTEWEILAEMGEKGVDPDEKLEGTFSGYGHASVADMARMPLVLAKAPQHLLFAMFNITSINSGQEKSSRYQKRFGRALVQPIKDYLPADLDPAQAEQLELDYQQIAQSALDKFNKHREILTTAYTAHYQPGEKDITARILDTARFFLPFGSFTGLYLETSARDWSRIIGELKASPIQYYHRAAEQIQQLYTPSKDEEAALGFRAEAPSLIRHSDPATITIDNLRQLKEHLEATGLLEQVPVNREFKHFVPPSVELLSAQTNPVDRMAAQYVKTLWPGMDDHQLMTWLRDQTDDQKRAIGELMFAGHNNYHELPPIAKTTGTSLIFHGSLGEIRDFNRHRAWGRFSPLPLVYGLDWNHSMIEQVLATGYGLPLYLTEIPEFAELGQDFRQDMEDYYAQIYQFVDSFKSEYGPEADYSFVVNLLPLAHQVDLWMHGDPKQALYFTHQRVRPGGHINYRDLAYRANQLLASSSPYLEAIRLPHRPDPANREEFLDRS